MARWDRSPLGTRLGGNFVPREAKRTTSFPGKLNELPTSIDEVRTRGLSQVWWPWRDIAYRKRVRIRMQCRETSRKYFWVYTHAYRGSLLYATVLPISVTNCPQLWHHPNGMQHGMQSNSRHCKTNRTRVRTNSWFVSRHCIRVRTYSQIVSRYCIKCIYSRFVSRHCIRVRTRLRYAMSLQDHHT